MVLNIDIQLLFHSHIQIFEDFQSSNHNKIMKIKLYNQSENA